MSPGGYQHNIAAHRSQQETADLGAQGQQPQFMASQAGGSAQQPLNRLPSQSALRQGHGSSSFAALPQVQQPTQHQPLLLPHVRQTPPPQQQPANLPRALHDPARYAYETPRMTLSGLPRTHPQSMSAVAVPITNATERASTPAARSTMTSSLASDTALLQNMETFAFSFEDASSAPTPKLDPAALGNGVHLT